jgi:glyoxylase-like metal-dependent hydrolase (beta-lactamase superfamily II)
VLVIFGDTITLVDTGVKGSEEKIFSYIEENKRKSSEIKTIILSHSHPDHIGSAAKIKELTGCRVISSKGEMDWIEDIDLQNRLRPVPGFFTLVDRSVKIDETVENGNIFKASRDITLEFIHSPGHSKGSLNLFFREDKILFTADSIPLRKDIPNYDNYPDLVSSLNAIKKNKNYNTLLSSWTPPFTDHSAVLKLISEGEEYLRSIDRMVKKNYIGNEPEPLFFCRKTIQEAGLPPFFVNPLVDRAFRSHLG